MNLSISLKEWILLSTEYEHKSTKEQDNETNSTQSARRLWIGDYEQFAYVQRALKVALHLLDFVNCELASSLETSQDSFIKAGGVRIDKIVVNIAMSNHDLSLTDGNASLDEILSDRSLDKIKSVVEGVTSISGHALDGTDLESEDTLKSLGTLLHQLFCRGKLPASHGHGNLEDDSNPQESVDDIEDSGEPGSAKSRRRQTLGGTCKSLRQMKISNNDDELANYNVPEAIRRLVVDLMQSHDDVQYKFETIDEVIDELTDIMNKPEIFLYEYSQSSDPNQLEFGNALHGRSDELGTLLQAALAASSGTHLLAKYVVLIRGEGGTGKSFLVEQLESTLVSSGWMAMRCKFDRLVQDQKFSAIASAFDNLFSCLLDSIDDVVGEEESSEVLFYNTMVSSIARCLPSSAIVLLGSLIPSLKKMFPEVLKRVVSDSDLSTCSNANDSSSSDGNDDDISDEIPGDMENSSNRLHFLFRRLLHALSSLNRPLLFFMDDLQWIDGASLSLLSSLIMESNHLFGLEEEDGNRPGIQEVLFVGAYREEVNESHPLTKHINAYVTSELVNLVTIRLRGIPLSAVRSMVSEALRLPIRMIKYLADVIAARTNFQPMFIKAFMQSLVQDNILSYSLEQRQSVWILDNVKTAPIGEDAAEMLKRNLLYLPANVVEALKFVSCFGCHFEDEVIQLFDNDDEEGLRGCLECASKMGIVAKFGTTYKFTHDLLQQAVYELMGLNERGAMHFQIGMQIMSKSEIPEGPFPNNLHFNAIGQINKAQSLRCIGELQPSKREVFATLNLKAALQLMKMSDFESGMTFVEFGISFLPESQWDSYYDLTLQLHNAACIAAYANSSFKKTMLITEEIFKHAVKLEDKMQAMFTMIKCLCSAGEIVQAGEKALDVLDQLCVSFPLKVSIRMIQAELDTTKSVLNKFSLSDISCAKVDPTHRWILRFLDVAQPCIFVTNPMYLPLLCCRMIQESARHGYCSESAIGMIAYGHAQITFFSDIEEGYKWGKNALLLLEKLKDSVVSPRAKFLFYAFVGPWKQPVQSSSESLLKAYQDALNIGDLESCMLSATVHISMELLSGANLSKIQKTTESLAKQSARTKQQHQFYILSSNMLAVLKLLGSSANPFDVAGNKLEDEDAVIDHFESTEKFGALQVIYFNRLFVSFWFKQYDEGAEMARKYRGHRAVRITDAYHAFYEGLIAFYFAKTATNTNDWISIGQEAILRFRIWAQHSTWNFQNKLMLLEAEMHFCSGQKEDAVRKYVDSIESAQRHRFVHEEGIAMERLGQFYRANGKPDEANKCISNAIDCYKRWGALGIIDLVGK